MSERFYVDRPLGSGRVVLQGAEAHHLSVVCRLRPGQPVCLFNGDGREYPATIAVAERKWVELDVGEPLHVDRELRFRLLVACPLPKGDRAQFLIEKLTELGVTEFVPLETQRSVVHPGKRRREKLERYVIEASKQCGRNVLLRVEPPQKWLEFLNRPNLPEQRLLAHPGGDVLERVEIRAADVAAAVGPEGGFTDEEASQGQAAGWRLIDLGPRNLRIETAAIGLAFRLACLRSV